MAGGGAVTYRRESLIFQQKVSKSVFLPDGPDNGEFGTPVLCHIYFLIVLKSGFNTTSTLHVLTVLCLFKDAARGLGGACAVERGQLHEKQQQSQQRGSQETAPTRTTFLLEPGRTAAISAGALFVHGAEPMNLASQSGDAGGSQLLFANFNQDNT